MCSNIETPKTNNFPFGTNGKLMGLSVPILEHYLLQPVGHCAFTNQIRYRNHRQTKCICIFVAVVSFVKYVPTKSKGGAISTFTSGQFTIKEDFPRKDRRR